MWEKEKLLNMSNLSFSHRVFRRLVQQTHKNQGLFGKGVTFHHKIPRILPFKNTVGCWRKCWLPTFFPFSTVLCTGLKETYIIRPTFDLSIVNALRSWQIYFNSFPSKPWFLRVCRTSLLKTLREEEKLLVMSIFSFSHIVFNSFRELDAIFIKIEIVVCKLFQFGRV